MADKKDLTGIFDLQKKQAENPEEFAPVQENNPEDPFAVNVLPDIEKIDAFESLDQIGMMDHPEPLTESHDPAIDPAPIITTFEAAPEMPMEPSLVFADEPVSESVEPFEQIREYSEKTSGKTDLEIKVFYPFHLKIQGKFGPFERDKLLLFISENPIGLNSSELDLQINSGRVFFPRISEYSAVKLIQDLRDSGLNFQLVPSDREADEGISDHSLHFSYDGQKQNTRTSFVEIPVISSTLSPQPSFQQIEEISLIQFVRTEVIEIENSPIIQEVVERMIEALKQKARIKGGNALIDLRKEITPLRLPSQYQISLKANVIQLL